MQGNVAPLFPSGPAGLEASNGGPHPPDMTDLSNRVSKVEGAVEGLKGSIDALRIVIGALQWVIGILAIVIVGGISFVGFQILGTSNRVTALETKVDELPDKINSNLQNLTRTLSDAITASKQQAPQVILMQPPSSIAPSPPEPPPQKH